MYNYMLQLHLTLKSTLAVIYMTSINITVTYITVTCCHRHVVNVRERACDQNY